MSSAAWEREVAMKTVCGPVPVTRQSETPRARWNSAAEIQSDPLVDSLIGNSFESCQSPKPVTSEDPAQTPRYSEVSARVPPAIYVRLHAVTHLARSPSAGALSN